MKLKVNVVIPTYNGHKWLQPLWDALNTTISKDVNWKMTLVDDGSSDGTKNWAIKIPQINYINQTANLGFAKACNLGARSLDSEYILFLNNDTVPLNGFLEAMIRTHENEMGVGAVGAKLLFPGGVACAHAGLKWEASGFPYEYGKGWKAETPDICITREMDGVTAACMIIKKELFDSLGGFSEDFVNGWEDSVTGDSPLIIRQGEFIDIVPIEDLYTESYQGRYCPVVNTEILSRDGWTPIKYCYRHKVKKPISKIVTQSGMVKITPDHSLFQNGKPMETKNINIGEQIDCIEIPELDNKLNTCTAEFAWLLGFFVAEGTSRAYKYEFNLNNWRICNTNLSLIEKAKKIAESFFCQPFKIYKYSRGKPRKDIFALTPIISKQFPTKLFSDICYTKNRKKKIPKTILNANIEIKNAFLDGYWEGDGHVEKRGNSIRRSCTTDSQVLAAGIQYLLKCQGRHTSILLRKDKPHIVQLRVLEETIGSNRSEKKERSYIPNYTVKSKILDNQKENFVYDIETDNHTFIIALGGIVAHNSDFCLRIKETGRKIFYCAEAQVIHHVYGSEDQGRFLHEADNKQVFKDKWIHSRRIDVLTPFWMAIATTWLCNLRCKHCAIWRKKMNKPELDVESFQLAISSEFFANITSMAIFGGEPTEYPPLCDLIAVCANRWPGQEIGVVTNGYATETQAKIWETIKNNIKCNLVVRVSIDGREEVHDRLRGVKGSFSQAVDTAVHVNTLWPRKGAISITVYPDTVDEIPYLIEFVEKLGINFCLRAAVSGSYFGGTVTQEWTPESINKLEHIIKNTPSNLFVFDRFVKALPEYLRTGLHIPCDAFRKSLVVDTDLQTSICHELPPMGQLGEIPKIWGRTAEWCQSGVNCLTNKCWKPSCGIDGPGSLQYVLD